MERRGCRYFQVWEVGMGIVRIEVLMKAMTVYVLIAERNGAMCQWDLNRESVGCRRKIGKGTMGWFWAISFAV
jgi:hypothetical protein